MPERVLRGVPASPGTAGGAARLLDPPEEAAGPVAPAEREGELRRARQALLAAAGQVEELAARLRSDGRAEEAEIVATGVLMAGDPALDDSVSEAVLERGLPAPAALAEATEGHAKRIAAVDDPTLAARADDVRSLGRRAARLSRGAAAGAAPADEDGVVLVARDLGPADVAELGPEVRAIALAAGGVTAHAAIVARSLGLPLAVGLGEELLAAREGEPVVVEGSDGQAVLGASPERMAAARAATELRALARERDRAQRDLPAVTRDGHRVRVLANAVTTTELAAALEAGAEGAGLIRTELAFLDSTRWPAEEDHRALLAPLLAPLKGMTATVRVLDFGGDKTPPFLAGSTERGIELLLRHPGALLAQLRAILSAGGDCDLRILLPLVRGPEDVRATRGLLEEAAATVGRPDQLAIGAMVELPEAAEAAPELARVTDFLSIGTNDLAASTLGEDRFAAGRAPAHDPRVLAHIARTATAAREAGLPVEVCGEAASDPVTAPLLVGLGVDELSVGAARVGTVRAWIRALSHAKADAVAATALTAADAAAVERLAEPLRRVLEGGDAAGESRDGGAGVLTVGPQH
jgi:phosphoenolpyruvate-protein kinase (PTS system EI component)